MIYIKTDRVNTIRFVEKKFSICYNDTEQTERRVKMRVIESRFLDLYKKTDALCADRLGGKNGMTDYIKKMGCADIGKTARVPEWRQTYNMLKHLRGVRNKIAHESGDSQCSSDDIVSLEEFYGRLSRRKDPLSLIGEGKASKKRRRKKNAGARKWIAALVFIIIIAILILLFLTK